MENIYYKQLFSKFSGYIYEYRGLIAENEDAKTFIIEQFISEADRVGLEISVSELKNGTFVLHSFENLESLNFYKICDLSEDPPPPLPEPTPQGEE